MTTSNPLTAVEALIAVLRERGKSNSHHDIMRAADLLEAQALQLHGGRGDGGSEPVSQSSLRSSVPPDQVLVPGEPTEAMIREGTDMLCNHFGLPDDILVVPMAAQAVYRAMIAAAPTCQQALSGGGEATPKSDAPSNPILQGPTREEVARIVRELLTDHGLGHYPNGAVKAACERKAIDAILALLNPTSPWREMRDVPRDGTEVVFISKFAHCSDVVHWRDEYFKLGLRFDGRFENRSGNSTGMNDDVAWLFWTPSPLPALHGGETGA